MLYRPPAPRYSRAASWSRWLGALGLVVGLIGFIGHRFGPLALDDAAAVILTAGIIGGCAVLLAGIGIAPVWQHGHLGAGQAILGFVYGLVTIVPAATLVYLVRTTPQLTDISTDLANPPLFRSAFFARVGSGNPITDPTPERAEIQRAAFPDIVPRRYAMGSAQLYRIARRVVTAAGWRITDDVVAREDGDMGRIEAAAYSLLSGVECDVVIRIYGEGSGSRVDIRSSSRQGSFDFGENAQRIRDFLTELDAQTGEG